jgi:hypothetical protein
MCKECTESEKWLGEAPAFKSIVHFFQKSLDHENILTTKQCQKTHRRKTCDMKLCWAMLFPLVHFRQCIENFEVGIKTISSCCFDLYLTENI